MLSKLVLARMRTLEEGFREVIWEIKGLRRAGERERERERERDRRKTNEGVFLKKGGKARQEWQKSRANTEIGSDSGNEDGGSSLSREG
ncbi:hypothetical protein EMPG_15806 [Blastomyces silverae]|uniref:Uncharacterized protein n=1 Tax=Blastomyces silverae TaxID=2060906 RepID=A0A0H1BBA9_9EURO|nr:hypothetical protein EMPG_15806 [Blastomyces silverae]